MNDYLNKELSGKEIKEGLYDKYIYKDGKKFIGQIVKSKDAQYQKISEYKRKTNDEYISIHNFKEKLADNNISLKYKVPTDVFFLDDDYCPLGKNIENDYDEIQINNLRLNSINTKKYLILKISGNIYIDKDKEGKMIGEDSNGDVVNISIKYIDRYFNPKNLDVLQNNIFKLGKYLIIIEPNYGVFDGDASNLDLIKIINPSEIILLEDKKELDDFLDMHKNSSAENYKLLGNLMIKYHFYEKAIFYYTQGIKLNKNDDKLEIILYSNLSEAYIKYGYFTKTIEFANYSLNKINILMDKDKEKEKDIFYHQLKIRILFRKLKALIALRKFKEAYDILYNNDKENNPNKDIIEDFLKLQQVKEYLTIMKKGYENTLGHYDYIEMLKEEKKNLEINNYGEYLNPKIEINYDKIKGLKMIAKEKINLGELLIVEKSLVFSEGDSDGKEDIIVSKDNPKVIAEIEMFNKLYLKLKKTPLDYEKFYYLTDGMNLNQDLPERKKYAEEQDKGLRNLELYKINQTICLNKYGGGRNILVNRDTCVGVWGYASFFNHDCLPNSNHFNIGDYYFGHSIREIDKGEEITSKYVSSTKSYKERQQTLLENWRFNCKCQLCKYQEKKRDKIYEDYMEMMDRDTKDIPKNDAQLFEKYMTENKKKFSCYELANAYLKLEEYYHIIRDFNGVQRLSELITKYADGKNYTFQLNNLYILILSVIISGKKDFFKIYKEIIKYLKKYTPLNTEEIEYLFKNELNRF